jgi:site-specific DNA recombinase
VRKARVPVSGNARRRVVKPRVQIVLPELPPHHHVGSCGCEPVIAYLRVSSLGGRTEIVSPQIQLDEIVADAARNNRRIIDVYFDLKSGKETKGRKIEQIVEEITLGQYRTVAVWKWNRWGRNTLQSLKMCAAVDAAGGCVVSATEVFDTKTPTGEMIRDMLLVQAAWQSRLIGQGWKDAQRLRREKGLPHSGKERWGYLLVNRRYVIDEEEAAFLRDAYRRLTNGTVSLGKLVREWNAKGLVTTLGGPWTEQGLGQMLDTGFAAGYIREKSKPTPHTRNNINQYDVWRKGAHDAIIDEELWQRYRAKREASAALPARLHTVAHALSRLLFCGLCSRRMSTHYPGRNPTHAWRCTHRAGMHPQSSVMLANSMAMMLIRQWVQEIIAEDDRSEQVTEQAQELIGAAPVVVSETDRLMDALADVQRRKDRLRRLFVAGIDPGLDEACYRRELKPLLDEEQTTRFELARVKARESTSDPSVLLPAFRKIDDLLDAPEVRPEELNALLSQVIGMVVVYPRTSSGRSLEEYAARVTVVPVWELDDWSDWFAERRKKAVA